MQIYFHSRLWSYLPRVPILVEGTVYIYFFFIKSRCFRIFLWTTQRHSCVFNNSRSGQRSRFASLLLCDSLKHVCTCRTLTSHIQIVFTARSRCIWLMLLPFFPKGFLWPVTFPLALNLVLKSHTLSQRAHHLVFWMHLHRYVYDLLMPDLFIFIVSFQLIISIHLGNHFQVEQPDKMHIHIEIDILSSSAFPLCIL